MSLFRWFNIILLLISCYASLAQHTHSRCINTAVQDKGILLDTLPVDASSISIVPSMAYRYEDKYLYLLPSDTSVDSVEICFVPVHPDALKPFFLKDPARYDASQSLTEKVTFNRPTPETVGSVFETPGIRKTGAISRGITTGNQQNAFVNSTMNLQLEGYLTDSLQIRAVITDQQIPYQPEGNTQQLRDFDRVYIELFSNKFNLLAGDIVLSNVDEHGYFLRYFKNQLGFQTSYQHQGENFISHTRASVAAAKGKFASISIEPLEGILGPYRLRGPNNERFIIILANTEAVYIDGERKARGFDKDYIIDYNLGEITFNPTVPITRFTRIRVDFEFVQQQYPRAIQHFGQEFKSNKLLLAVEYYRESDNANQPLIGGISSLDKASLSLAGINATSAFVSGIDSIGFLPGQIRYARRDTIVNNQRLTYFELSSDPSQAAFALQFTRLGQGQGNYVRSQISANGLVYEWVAPINGEPQGEYEPVNEVILPNSREMAVTKGKYEINEKLTVSHESAFSRQIQNLYALPTESPDLGYASLSQLIWKNVSLPYGYEFSGNIGYEFNNHAFRPIDRFRYIEFDRDWSYLSPYDSLSANEQIITLGFMVRRNQFNLVKYDLTHRTRENQLKGYQQHLTVQQQLGKFFYNGTQFMMNNDQILRSASWIRSQNESGIALNLIKTGVFYEIDQNALSDILTDEVQASAMYFSTYGVFIQNGENTKVKWNTRLGSRRDFLPVQGQIVPYTDAWQLTQSVSYDINSSNRITFNGVYRRVTEQILTDVEPEMLQANLILANQLWKGAIKSQLNYAVHNARELRRNFVFVQVGAGQGTHTWRDENGDGIQDLNEFYEAINADERNFIKLFLPTDEYVDAYQQRFLHTLDIKAPSDWRKSSGIKSSLAKFSINTNLNFQQRTTSAVWSERLNPFAPPTADLLAYRNQQRYSFFYNRSGGKVGLSAIYQSRDVRSLNQLGFEVQNLSQCDWNMRWMIMEGYQLNLTSQRGTQGQSSDFLQSRNFELAQWTQSGELIWQPTSKVRFTGSYRYKISENIFESGNGELSVLHDWGFSGNYSSKAAGMATAGINFIQLRYTGDPATYLGYILLEGLNNGQNMRLNANWQQNLKNGLQLNFQYFGRVSAGQAMVHTGSLQLTAFF